MPVRGSLRSKEVRVTRQTRARSKASKETEKIESLEENSTLDEADISQSDQQTFSCDQLNILASESIPKTLRTSSDVCSVRVDNLVRPFAISDLKQCFSSLGGTILKFWINQIKSTCYIQYDNEISCQTVISKFHETHWPEHNKKKISVILADMSKMFVETGGEMGKKADSVSNEMSHIELTEKKEIVIDEEEITKMKEEEMRKTKEMLINVFRHTKTIPMIYWLPVHQKKLEAKKYNSEMRVAQNSKQLKMRNHELGENFVPAKIRKIDDTNLSKKLISYPSLDHIQKI